MEVAEDQDSLMWYHPSAVSGFGNNSVFLPNPFKHRPSFTAEYTAKAKGQRA